MSAPTTDLSAQPAVRVHDHVAHHDADHHGADATVARRGTVRGQLTQASRTVVERYGLPQKRARADGEQIVAVSSLRCDDESSGLVVLNSDGSGEPNPIVEAPASWPDWSPDGRHLVYVGINDAGDSTLIVVSDPDGANAHPLELPGINTPTEPSWAPDGHRIAFVSPTGTYGHENPADWNEDVYITDAGATDIERVTTTAGNDHWPPAWSPDGTTLIYSSDGTEAKHGDLMSIHLESHKITRLTDTDTNDLLADWRN